MWLKTGDFALSPLDDFVLTEIDPLQTTIPLPILKELLPTFPSQVFSVVMYETAFNSEELELFDKLVDVLQDKGVLVVSLGSQSPNAAFAQELLDTLHKNKDIVAPALMTRFGNITGGRSYAFRFKKKVNTPSEPAQQVPEATQKGNTKKKKK